MRTRPRTARSVWPLIPQLLLPSIRYRKWLSFLSLLFERDPFQQRSAPWRSRSAFVLLPRSSSQSNRSLVFLIRTTTRYFVGGIHAGFLLEVASCGFLGAIF